MPHPQHLLKTAPTHKRSPSSLHDGLGSETWTLMLAHWLFLSLAMR